MLHAIWAAPRRETGFQAKLFLRIELDERGKSLGTISELSTSSSPLAAPVYRSRTPPFWSVGTVKGISYHSGDANGGNRGRIRLPLDIVL